MKIDIYLGFTSCRGNCIFCRKGKGLSYFPRPSYMSDPRMYRFFHFSEIDEADNFFDEKLSGVDSINISGNEPLSWGGLEDFVKKIRLLFPSTTITLRTSNTYRLEASQAELFDKFEFSLYGHNMDVHNLITNSNDSWYLLHENIALLQSMESQKKILFQTIFLRENMPYIKEILLLMREFSYKDNPLKIVYPYFMPVADASSLPEKSSILKGLIQEVGVDFLKKNCILVNFSLPKRLTSLFLDASE